MQAALTAKARGYRVSLFDEGELGGRFNLAVIPPGKGEMRKPLAAMVDRVRRAGITLHLRRRATTEDIMDERPRCVILATGSTPKHLALEGIDFMLVSDDVLREDRELGHRVLIIGGGMVGLETAEFLSKHGHSVSVVEMVDEVGRDMEPITRKLLLNSLHECGVNIITGRTVKRFTDRAAFLEGTNGDELLGEFDAVVSAVGAVSSDGLQQELTACGLGVHVIGDAKSPRNIVEAVSEGFEIGCSV